MGEVGMGPKERENPRLKHFDYSSPGFYFVTQCTKQRNKNILSRIVAKVGADDHIGPDDGPVIPLDYCDSAFVQLTPAGEIVRELIEGIPKAYQNVFLETYVIMPDHLHMILKIQSQECGPMWSSAPTANAAENRTGSPADLLRIVRSLKSLSTKRIGCQVWQRSFYDRIIRTPDELNAFCQYIAQNPIRWLIKHAEGDTHA